MKKTMLIIFAVGLLSAALAKENTVKCANLIFAGTQTSRCFSDEFLSVAQKKTAIGTERHFQSVKLASDELFKFPFVMITGESDFFFSKAERENLKKYLESGGFMLASAGCSSKKFDDSFRREIKTIFGDKAFKPIPKDHVIFRTVNKIEKLDLRHSEGGAPPELLGMEMNGKIVLVYSPHGLNDTSNTEGCCCCGGNEISNSLDVNVNVLVYALLH